VLVWTTRSGAPYTAALATQSKSLNPAQGWDAFARTEDVEELVWEVLAGWHYMNPTAKTSVWESDSGATFYLAFDDDHQLIEAVAGAGATPDEDLDALCGRLRRTFGIVAAED